MAQDLILGTAGHIDHGKTSLVRALTGTDTDRLPEEKRRGITIELGFAELDLGEYRLGIVDVPGHERFVRQMLAGATGMDLAMLVVAADDSVKPQTREHMDVLRLLDLKAGVIALTKCDIADEEWMDLVEAEIRELVAGTIFAQGPIVRTSAQTGQGIDNLRQALLAAARHAAANVALPHQSDPFRMAIDRSFTMPGHGTVVTGSVASGSATNGQTLVIQPDGVEVRVRGLRNHGREVARVSRGQRAAINLAGVHHEAVVRGNELATPGHLVPSRLLTVDLSLLSSAPRPLKHRATLRLHVGTAEELATVALLRGAAVPPGARCVAQLYLREPVVTVWNQPFVLRAESPVETIGGGSILVANPMQIRRLTAEDESQLGLLASTDPLERAGAAIYFQGMREWDVADLPRLAGIEQGEEIVHKLKEAGTLLELEVSPRRTLTVHERVLQQWSARITNALRKLHAQEPLRSHVDRAGVVNRFDYIKDKALLNALLRMMHENRQVRLGEKHVALVDHSPSLSTRQRALLDEIIDRYQQAGFQPPTVQEYQKSLPKQANDVAQLIELAEADGQLVHIGKDMYLHSQVERQLREKLGEQMQGHQGMTLSGIREVLGTTRKYAVPFCEYLDRIEFTRRVGDLRVLVDAAADHAPN